MVYDIQYCRWSCFLCLTVSHKFPQETLYPYSSVVITHFWKCLITPGKQPCPIVIAEIFRNGPYYHGTQCLPREFVWHCETQKTLPPTVLYVTHKKRFFLVMWKRKKTITVHWGGRKTEGCKYLHHKLLRPITSQLSLQLHQTWLIGALWEPPCYGTIKDHLARSQIIWGQHSSLHKTLSYI